MKRSVRVENSKPVRFDGEDLSQIGESVDPPPDRGVGFDHRKYEKLRCF